MVRIIVVGEQVAAHAVARALVDAGFELIRVGSIDQALSRLRDEPSMLCVLVTTDWAEMERLAVGGASPTDPAATVWREVVAIGAGTELATSSLERLVTRVGNICRGLTMVVDNPGAADRVEIGSLAIEPQAAEAFFGGQPLGLTVTESRVLLLLARRRGRLVMTDELLERIWGRARRRNRSDRTVSAQMLNLRRKLAAAGVTRISIETRTTSYGVGYSLLVAPQK